MKYTAKLPQAGKTIWIASMWGMMLLAAGCSKEENKLILSSPMVSLQANHPPKNQLIQGKYIQVRWCSGDKIYTDPKRHGSLIEQVIAKAHSQTQSKYFLNASFYQEQYSSAGWTLGGTIPCVTMRGHTSKRQHQLNPSPAKSPTNAQ